ncbi:E3 ubiquitin-protein ligase mbr2-like, partial [Thalictrum thalictroides]
MDKAIISMQEQRGSIGSFTETSQVGQQRSAGSFIETHEFLHGTSPNNTGGGHQRLCYVQNQAENRLMGHHTSDLEGRRYGLTNHPSVESIDLSLGSNQNANDTSDSQTMQFGRIPWNINLNAVYAGNSGGIDHVHESDVFPHLYKPGGSETNDISLAGSPGNPSGIAFGSVGHDTVEGGGRPGCSSDGRCLPCKRKATDDDVSGQLLQGGSPREQPAEDVVPAHNVACSSNVSFVTENTVALNQQFDLNFQYEVRERVAPSTILPVVGAASFPLDTQRSSHLIIDHGRRQYPDQLGVNGIGHNGSSAITDYLTRVQHQSQFAPHAFHIPGVQQTVGPLSREASSSTRFGSLTSVMVGERPSVLPADIYSTNMSRAPEDRPFQIPMVHTTVVAQPPTNLVLANGNISLLGRHNSISQVGSSSRPGVPRRAPNYLTTIQHTRRLAGIRRTLVLATDSDSEDETIGPFLSPDISQQGNTQPFQGPVFRSDIQDDEGAETRLLSRALHADRENRRRLLSEIRRVMALFSRGGHPDLQ